MKNGLVTGGLYKLYTDGKEYGKKLYRKVTVRFPWYRVFLRWIMVSLLVCYMFPWEELPLLSPGAAKPEPAPRNELSKIESDPAKGIGGYEPTVSKISVENASYDGGQQVTGIFEPAEFSKSELLLYTSHKIEKDETIISVAQKFGLNQDTIISVNGITNARHLQKNQVLRVPNQDGILYQVKPKETLQAIAKKFDTDVESIQTVNELFPGALVRSNTSIFIPGAKLDPLDLQEINGDLFAWPVRGYITSHYGYRASPFTGVRQFHSGLDIGVPTGTPVKAAMAGRVTTAGYDKSYGNYVVISHYAGYRTLYAHLSVIRTKPGAYVGTGERIGDAGSTGVSTGPHLHFTVYKNGVTVNPRSLLK
ncbi:MAG: M23 family metallopeptidase [Spirochaetaceae bacterium]|nr:M23 family metallopeptidase [Spirochaetaceae bacterium]